MLRIDRDILNIDQVICSNIDLIDFETVKESACVDLCSGGKCNSDELLEEVLKLIYRALSNKSGDRIMDMQNKIFHFAYMMAFRDATMRNAFPRRTNEKDCDEAFHDRKEKIKEHSETIVQSYIDKIIREETVDPLKIMHFYDENYIVLRTPDFNDKTRLLKPGYGLHYLGKEIHFDC